MFYLTGVVQFQTVVLSYWNKQLSFQSSAEKANIPHRVYLFSDAYQRGEWSSMGDEGFLVELFSNEMNNKKYKEMMVNVASSMDVSLPRKTRLER